MRLSATRRRMWRTEIVKPAGQRMDVNELRKCLGHCPSLLLKSFFLSLPVDEVPRTKEPGPKNLRAMSAVGSGSNTSSLVGTAVAKL